MTRIREAATCRHLSYGPIRKPRVTKNLLCPLETQPHELLDERGVGRSECVVQGTLGNSVLICYGNRGQVCFVQPAAQRAQEAVEQSGHVN